MSWVYTGMMQAVGASNKVFQFIDRKPEIRYDIGKLAPAQLEGRLEFKNLSFSYPSRPDTEVLKVGIFNINNNVYVTFTLKTIFAIELLFQQRLWRLKLRFTVNLAFTKTIKLR